MNIQYSHLIPVALAALMAGACSDSQSDMPVPVADPATYITFAPPTLNLTATMADFADNRYSGTSRAKATEVGNFRVWGFCVGRNVQNNDYVPTTALQEWNDKSSYFREHTVNRKDKIADLDNLNGDLVDASSGLYNSGTLTEWNTDYPDALHTFIGATSSTDNVDFKMQPAGTDIVVDATTDPVTKKVFKGPSLKMEIKHTSTDIITSLKIDDQPDIMVAASFDKKSGSGRVPMSFMHVMTGIRFKLHNHANKKLIIHTITYGGKFFKTAYLDFTTDSPELYVDERQTYSGIFTMVSKEQVIDAGSSDFMEGNPDRVMLLLPNPAGTTADDGEFVLGSNKTITIRYNLEGDDENPDIEGEREKVISDFRLNYLPQPNTLHTANLHFVGDEFVIVFQDDSSKNWQNGTDGNRVDITIK